MWFTNNDKPTGAKMKELENRIENVERFNEVCDSRHRRSEDMLKIFMSKVDRICASTEATARGDAAKEVVRQAVLDAAKFMGAIGIIIVSLWHTLEYLFKFWVITQ